MANFRLINKAFRSCGIYIGTSIFNHAASFLLLPVLTRFLNPLHYGILATFQSIYPLSQSFIDMGSTTAVARRYFETEDREQNFHHYIFNSIIIKGTFFILLSVLLFICRKWLSNRFSFPQQLISLVALIAFSSAFIDTVTRLLIAQKKAVVYSIFQCSRTMMNIGLSFFLVTVIHWNWQGRIYGITVTEFIFMLGCFLFLLRNNLLGSSLRLQYFREILGIGVPLFIYGIGWWVITLADRLFLNAMLGVSVTGVYSVGYSLASVIEFIAGGIGMALMPFLFERFANPSEAQKRTIVRYTYLYFMALFFVTIAWIYSVPFFIKIFIGGDFAGSYKFVPLVAFAYFANAIFRMFSFYITYSKKTYYLVYSVAFAATVNLIFNFILIRSNGAIGAAQSTFISYAANACLTWYFAQKVYPMPWFSFMRNAS